MVFVINDLKFDTDKMELISSVIHYEYQVRYILLNSDLNCVDNHAKLYKSVKGRYLIVYNRNDNYVGVHIGEETAKSLLLKSDLEKYEEQFGQLEEA